MRATQRLSSRGFEAYLVGGCVRDLLLGRPAKDYDIATGARPQQVKRVFPRNCRIIGRRFKLAHLHFHDNTKILEVSTFRRSPQVEGNENDDLLITRDNEFGTAEEDALRRDFTVNALFLDPNEDRILDWTNGLDDLHARVIRTIGDPRVRFREDPVRILRAAKFAGRLGFTIEPETFAAMAETAGDLTRAAPPRLLEEILRLLRGGHALESFQLLRDVGALRSILPVLADFLQTARHEQRVAFWRLLEALDHRVQGGHVPPNGVLLGVLLVCPVLARSERSPDRSPSSIAEELLGPLCADLRLPRRDAGCLKRICGVQHRFAQPGKRFRVAGFVQGPYFDEALELFELRTQALGQDPAAIAEWVDLAERGGHHPVSHDHEVEGDDEREPVELTAADEADDVDETDDAAPPWQDGDDVAAAGTVREDAVREDAVREDSVREDSREDAVRESGEGDVGEGDADQPGRRRRRRRRRRRSRGGDDAPAAATPREDEDDYGETTRPRNADAEWHADSDRGDAADHAVGAASDPDEPPEHELLRPFAGITEPASFDDDPNAPGARRLDAPPEADDADAEGDGPRRRRRRRGRRGRRRGGDRFPASEEPAPHGEALDADADHAPLRRDDLVADPDAPADDADEAESEPDVAGGSTQHDENAPAQTGSGEGEREGGRRRRRRGRRGRKGGSGEGGDRAQGDRAPGDRAQGDRAQSDRPQGDRAQGDRSRGERQGQERKQSDGGQRQDRGERGRRRDQRRRGGPTPRDVDVVPRYRDRRGKVEVIEPPPLDLSAFDVELDPKRVPTFGSIVEGQGRPKRRGPRVPQDGVDDYRPPPPPGSDSGPSAPPPPPPADDDDTFGDW